MSMDRAENGSRFACELSRDQEKMRKDFPVLIKINALDRLDPKEAPVQLTRNYLAIAPYLEKAGVDEIHLSGVPTKHRCGLRRPYYVPKAAFAGYAEMVKKVVKSRLA